MNFLKGQIFNHLETTRTFWIIEHPQNGKQALCKDYESARKLISNWVIRTKQRENKTFILEFWNDEEQMYQSNLEQFFQTPMDEKIRNFSFRERQIEYPPIYFNHYFTITPIKCANPNEDLL